MRPRSEAFTATASTSERLPPCSCSHACVAKRYRQGKRPSVSRTHFVPSTAKQPFNRRERALSSEATILRRETLRVVVMGYGDYKTSFHSSSLSRLMAMAKARPAAVQAIITSEVVTMMLPIPTIEETIPPNRKPSEPTTAEAAPV